MKNSEAVETLHIDAHEVRITHPGKLYFSKVAKVTKLDLVNYFLSIAPGVLSGICDRPIVLKRFVNGAEQEPFYQKRAPADLPAFLRTVELLFPSGRSAQELVIDSRAGLAWIVNLGCIELHPHPVRSLDLSHPDQLRIDLDPGPGIDWNSVRKVALEVNDFLSENGLRGWPKTSGSRGMHIIVSIEPRWTFTEVRRAALALSRAIEKRMPNIATSKWWKEERHGVFLDYNQNAKDRTTCSAYSVRPVPDARVSTPLHWNEVADCEPSDFTIFTIPDRYAKLGDPHQNIANSPGSLEKLLELAAVDEAAGLGDAPWPSHFRKMDGEAPRVAPSRAKSAAKPKREKMPLLVIAHSPDKQAAVEGLERWKARHAKVVEHLLPEDILIDSMRGRSSTWTRIRINLKNVPESLRPAQQTPDPDHDPTREWREYLAAKRAAKEKAH